MPRHRKSADEERLSGRRSQSGKRYGNGMGAAPKAPAAQITGKPPSPPSDLSEAAKTEWDRLAPALWRSGRLTTATAGAFARYVSALAMQARWQTALDEAAATGTLILERRTGSKYTHPAARELASWSREVDRRGRPFGLDRVAAPQRAAQEADPAQAKWVRPRTPKPKPSDPLYAAKLHLWTISQKPPGYYGFEQTRARNLAAVPCPPGSVRWESGQVYTPGPDGGVVGEVAFAYLEDGEW